MQPPNESLGLCFEKTSFTITAPDNTQLVYNDGLVKKPISLGAEIHTGTLDTLSRIEHLQSTSICKASSLRNGIIFPSILDTQDSSVGEQEYTFLLLHQKQPGRYDIQVQDSLAEPVPEPSMVITLNVLSLFSLLYGRKFKFLSINKRPKNG